MGGTVLFLVLAIADQWSFFASAWFGPRTSASKAPKGPPPVALKAIDGFLERLPKYYGGPEQAAAFFREVPLTDSLRGELMSDAAYLGWRGWSQEMTLLEYSVAESEPLPNGRWEVVTDEAWRVTVTGGTDGGGGREVTLRCRYRVGLVEGRWTLGAWTLEPPPRKDAP